MVLVVEEDKIVLRADAVNEKVSCVTAQRGGRRGRAGGNGTSKCRSVAGQRGGGGREDGLSPCSRLGFSHLLQTPPFTAQVTS